MAFNDFRGYYEILGIQPSATQSLIKAAYRIRAMELHPDRNLSDSATADTQKLNEAYAVLSDEEKRSSYDTLCQTNSSTDSPNNGTSYKNNTAAPAGSTNHQADSNDNSRIKPVTCTKCGAISAQPRFREYITVKSWLITSNKSTEQGIYCQKCDTRTALRATGTTTILGWWGFYGFFWSLEALFKNLTASWRFIFQDASLLYVQALHFFSIGRKEFAYAIAMAARGLSRELRPNLSNEDKRRAELGYNTKNSIQELRDSIAELIQNISTESTNIQLVSRTRFAQSAFYLQVAIVSPLILIAGLLVGNAILDSNKQKELRERAEQARLEREGFERAKAVALARQEAETLSGLVEPLPQSGLMRKYGPPAKFYSSFGLPNISVQAPNDESYFIKLSEWSTGNIVQTIFVRAGETTVVPVPLGAYKITMAAGTTWYGEKVRFGPKTKYTKIDDPAEFKLTGDRLIGKKLILTEVKNGNLHPSEISADGF